MSENEITSNKYTHVFISQGDEVNWWKLNNDELQNLYSSCNNVIMIKSKEWDRQVMHEGIGGCMRII
jgi:hypothetical protein